MKIVSFQVPKRPTWPVFVGFAGFACALFTGVAEEVSEAVEPPREAPSQVDSAGENSRHPLARYEQLWQRSLFHAPVEAVVADPAFAREYTLAGIFEMDGSTTAALLRKRDGVVVNVSDGDDAGSRAEGLKLLAVEQGTAATSSRVQVEKGGVRAWITAQPAPTSLAPRPSLNRSNTPSPGHALETTEFSDWENFSGMSELEPKPQLPRREDRTAAPPVEVPTPSAPPVTQPVPVPPSPLDAAMTDEKEIVVPIED